MNPLTALIVTEHLLDLRREADASRVAAAARRTDGPRGRGRLQRLAGRSARALSRAFAGFASRVDPADAARPHAREERGTRPLAA